MKTEFCLSRFALPAFVTLSYCTFAALGEQTARLGISEVQPTPALVDKYLSPAGPDPAHLAALPDLIEALNNQTAARLQTMRQFKIVEPGDLNKLMGWPPIDAGVDFPAPAPIVVPTSRPMELEGKLYYNGGQFPLKFSRLESPSEPPFGPSTNDSPVDALALRGKWQGRLLHDKVELPAIMEITQAPDGTAEGTFKNVENGRINLIEKIEYVPPFLRIKFGKGNFGWGKGTFVVDLNSTRRPPEPAPRKLHLSAVYDLKDLTTMEQFKQAGIQYLLAMTLEDFSDQTLDLIKGQSATAYVNKQGSGNLSLQTDVNAEQTRTDVRKRNRREVRQDFQGGLNATGNWQEAYSAQAGLTQYEPNVRKQQTMHLSVRCRLFGATTGTLLVSQNCSFSTNRIYTTSAAANNEQSKADLCQSAARFVAEWAAVQVVDTVYPMKVLEKNDNRITVNRGTDSGIRVGQVYNVYKLGEEIKDPGTGESLGRKEITVGKVVIDELHPQFSSAKVLSDSNIISGAVLRLAAK
jgi:hypothetical protein